MVVVACGGALFIFHSDFHCLALLAAANTIFVLVLDRHALVLGI